MRFLADESVEAAVVTLLRSSGHDVVYVAEMAPGMSDSAVLELANGQQRLLLTNDKDFGTLVFLEKRATEGVVLLRLREEGGEKKASRLSQLLPALTDRVQGHFVVVGDAHIRIRPLHRDGPAPA